MNIISKELQESFNKILKTGLPVRTIICSVCGTVIAEDGVWDVQGNKSELCPHLKETAEIDL